MRRVQYTKRAEADLEILYAYSRSEWGDTTAEEYVLALAATCQRLATTPHEGRAVNEVYRRVRHERHIVYYRIVSDDELLIVRIVHERQLPPKHL